MLKINKKIWLAAFGKAKNDIINFILTRQDHQELPKNLRISLFDDNIGDGKFLSNILLANKVSHYFTKKCKINSKINCFLILFQKNSIEQIKDKMNKHYPYEETQPK